MDIIEKLASIEGMKDLNLTCRYFQEGWGLGNMDKIYHVIPINELNEHHPTIKCKCKPEMEIVKIPNVETMTYEEYYLILHNSFLLEQISKSLSN